MKKIDLDQIEISTSENEIVSLDFFALVAEFDEILIEFSDDLKCSFIELKDGIIARSLGVLIDSLLLKLIKLPM